MPPAATETRDRIESILRNDLKLGPEVSIDSDTELLGGAYDLDSLDILLLVTSVEKAFGIKIPSADVGKEAFRSVGSLVQYVEVVRNQRDG